MLTSDLEAPRSRSATPVGAADADSRTARERIVYAHGGALLALARRLTSNETVARDAIRDAFVQAFDAAPPFESDAAAARTLRRLTVRYIAATIETGGDPPALEALLPSYDAVTGHLHSPPSWVTPLADVLERADARASIRRWVETLPDAHRLVLVDSEGMSVEEAAEAHGEPVSNIKRRLHEARQALTTRLAREFASRGPRH